MNVYEKLQTCRVELQKKEIRKSGQNKHTGFSYFTLDDFIPHINELFAKYKLTSAFSLNTLGEPYAELRIINIEKPDEVIEFTSPIADAALRGSTPIQSLGAVHTYMRRYLYLNALEIVEPDFLDPAVGDKDLQPEPEKKSVRGIEVSQVKLFKKQKPEILDKILSTYGVEVIEMLTYDQAKTILDGLKAKGNLIE